MDSYLPFNTGVDETFLDFVQAPYVPQPLQRTAASASNESFPALRDPLAALHYPSQYSYYHDTQMVRLILAAQTNTLPLSQTNACIIFTKSGMGREAGLL